MGFGELQNKYNEENFNPDFTERKEGRGQRCPSHPFRIILEILTNVIREIEKERKLSKFTDDMTIYVENMKECTKKTPPITNSNYS